MKNFIYEQLKICCDEFQNMLLSNHYISTKNLNDFLDKYVDILKIATKNYVDIDDLLSKKILSIINEGYSIIDKRNKKYIDKKLIEYKDYFDNMFKDIDSNILLDDDQRKAILVDEDYSLVIAGAGSGKTTTMAAKVKYSIEKCNVSPNKIILLAFTNKAAYELDERINKDFKLGVEVLTFHKLGMKFIRKIFDKPVKIVSEGTMYNYISDYVTTKIFPNKELLRKFMETFDNYVTFDDSVFKYNSFDEYFDSYVKSKYEENKENLEAYILPRIENRLKQNRSINGEFLKSKNEVLIANYLFKNGYNYKYEKVYPYKLDNDRSYSPDFTVWDYGINVYIEYYGLTTLKDNNTYTTDDINTYRNLILKKRQLHKKYGTDLIELYSEYSNGDTVLNVLKKALNKRNIKSKQKTSKEIFERLMYTSREVHYFKFMSLVMAFIRRFKEKGYNLKDFDLLINKAVDSKEIEQLKFIRAIFNYYDKGIHKNYQIDFNDMINYAYLGLEKAKAKDKYLNYDYLIIDEYQDISRQRYNLAKKLSDLFESKIVAVGDDWQAIYSFSGSDVELFTRFSEMMGYAQINKITNTYRNSQELIDIAGDFVSRNKEQFTKKLISNKHLDNPVKLCYYDEQNPFSKAKVLDEIIGNLYKENKNNKILLLGRYKNDINDFIDSAYFKSGPYGKIICKQYPNAKIEFLTVHKSKGLGYDQVIILNAKNAKYGFPSQIIDEPLLTLLDDDKKESIEFAEERRLFYVALTRTKGFVYILVPDLPILKRSKFVMEIKDEENVYEDYSYME